MAEIAPHGAHSCTHTKAALWRKGFLWWGLIQAGEALPLGYVELGSDSSYVSMTPAALL